MKLSDLINVTTKSSRWIINDDNHPIFLGYRYLLTDELLEANLSDLYEKIKDREVESFKFHLDINHKQWQEKGLMSPLMPEELPHYNFSDLQETLYYEVRLKRKEQE